MIGAIGERDLLASLPLEAYPGVDQVLPIVKPYKLVSRELAADLTVIDVRGRKLGDSYFGFIAGPCTVEYREQTLETARSSRRPARRGCAAARSSRGRRRTRSRGSVAPGSRSSPRRARRPGCRW